MTIKDYLDEGRKYDSGKVRYGLLPLKALKEVSEVLTFGAVKYGDNNWRLVDNLESRYFDAAMRHLLDWKSGNLTDKESNKHELAHSICCLMFILEKQLEK